MAAVKQAFETSPTPYLKAFDTQTWIVLVVSMLVMTMIYALEGALLHQQKPRIGDLIENMLRAFQSLLQESSKERLAIVASTVYSRILSMSPLRSARYGPNSEWSELSEAYGVATYFWILIYRPLKECVVKICGLPSFSVKLTPGRNP